MIACCVLHNIRILYFEQNETFFIRDKCCHLTLCLQMMKPHYIGLQTKLIWNLFWRNSPGMFFASLVNRNVRHSIFVGLDTSPSSTSSLSSSSLPPSSSSSSLSASAYRYRTSPLISFALKSPTRPRPASPLAFIQMFIKYFFDRWLKQSKMISFEELTQIKKAN